LNGKDTSSDFGSGLGLGIGFAGAGVLCLWVPEYLGASSGWTTFWFATGAVLALIGVAGSLTELEGRFGKESGFGYLGASVAVAGVGGVLHLVQARDAVEGSAASALRVAAVCLVLFALTGFGMGLGQLVARQGRGEGEGASGHPIQVAVSLFVAALSLATAILNFMAAGT
jgi:hypothetical protein